MNAYPTERGWAATADPGKGGAFALRWLKCGLTALLLLGNVSCGSSMRNYQGHVVFNPLYLFYLESPARDRWQKPAEVLQALQVAQGHVVADIGAGGGYFTEKLQQRVGPAGHVYATDVQEVMLKKLRKRFAQPGHANVTVIHATFDDPRLPPGACDLVLFSSVYKEIEGREAYMKKVSNALKPGGRVAILEYRPDDRSPGPPRRYRLAESQVIAEMQAAGFVLQQRFEFLPREYFLVFSVGR